MQTTKKLQILIESISRDQAQSSIAFSRLLILRWGALVCQSFIVLAVILLTKIQPPVLLLTLIIIFGAGSNICFHLCFLKKNRAIPGALFALVMFLDILLLTVLLYYTGGAMNPFTFLFLIHVCLGAILMRPLWAWSLAACSTLCYGIFFFLPDPVAATGTAGHNSPEIICQTGLLDMNSIALHLQGMWLAFAITVFFIVFFLGKIQKDLEEHQKTIAELELERNRSEKLASLATLAAGAAHEFSTPLATIAVASGEMFNTMKEHDEIDPELVADTQLIRDQVKRCRDILYQMSADAGEHLAEALQNFTVERLFSEVLAWFPEEKLRLIRIDCKIQKFRIRMPFRTLKRIIRGLLKNALDASPPGHSIFLSCRADEKFLSFTIRDSGQGMDEATLARAVEPFFTTKEVGKGLGLGLFLAESAAERFGGELKLTSAPGKGTTAVISFALQQISPVDA